MARSVDVDFTFKGKIDVPTVLRLLVEAGMRASTDGRVSYLIDDDGMFDWQKGESWGLDEIISRLGDTRWIDRIVGIVFYFPDSDSGGDFLFHPGREVISCVFCVNPKAMENSLRFCDVGWYLAKLIPVFEPLGLVEVETRDSA